MSISTSTNSRISGVRFPLGMQLDVFSQLSSQSPESRVEKTENSNPIVKVGMVEQICTESPRSVARVESANSSSSPWAYNYLGCCLPLSNPPPVCFLQLTHLDNLSKLKLKLKT
ncbi:hypothetical protein KQX54_008057 [Cotesia glomerata]|uniref:Uncharacterized protein n=1 Tax=Cotesia glomerata TaxID=32391 RepID=A0AAV7J8B7_COTGL|nr:hypothetical protein KQX54_008057 [Cotesia glomerata]